MLHLWKATQFSFVIVCLAVLPVFSQIQKNTDESYLKKIAFSTLEISLDESRQVKNFEERTEIAKEIIEVLYKQNPNQCLQAIELLFNDFGRLDAKDFPDAESFVEFQNKIAGKIIKLAALLDKKLAQKYLDRYLSNLPDSLPEDEKNSNKPDLSRVYLKIASEILESNRDYAISVAENSLKYEVNLDTLSFLALLHKKDNVLADNLCNKAIRAVNQRNLRDINESFVLYSYIFSTSQVPAVVSNSPVYFPLSLPELYGKEVNTNLANFFLQSSVEVLTNNQPRSYADQFQVSQGAIGDYFFLKTIEVFVSKYAPNLLEQVKNLHIPLFNLVESKYQETIQAPDQNRNNSASTKENLLKKAESEQNPKKKDAYLYQAAMIVVKEGSFDEALKIADQLSENADETTKPYIKYVISRKLIEKNRVDEALDISKNDKDLARKVSILIFSARELLKDKTKFYQTSGLLSEAEKLIEKVVDGKGLLLIAISNVYSEFNVSDALSTWQEAVKITNLQKDFTGMEKLQRSFDEGNGFYTFYELLDGQMGFKPLASKMSAKAFLNMLQLTQNIENKSFKLKTLTALCKNKIAQKTL